MEETASLELEARGRSTKEMKKEGIWLAVENSETASTSGSANTAASRVPAMSNITAFFTIWNLVGGISSLSSSSSSSLSFSSSPRKLLA